jgi:hypothetical protein
MKKILLPVFFAAFTLVSAATNAQTLPPGWPFPEKNERTREKEERRKDKDERVTRDRDGNVITRDRRVDRNDRNLPPGQAKKKYGSKSAKVYAPGQRKKVERTDDGIFGSRRDRDDDKRDTDIFGTRRDRDDDDGDQRKKQKKQKNKGRK